MRMTLLIGNRSPAGGFTFLELMLSIAILASGVVAVNRGLIAALDYRQELTSRLYAMNLADHELAVIQSEYQILGQIPEEENEKVINAVLDYRPVPFQVNVILNPVEPLSGLAQAQVIVSWQDKGRTINCKRAVLLVNNKSKFENAAPET